VMASALGSSESNPADPKSAEDFFTSLINLAMIVNKLFVTEWTTSRGSKEIQRADKADF